MIISSESEGGFDDGDECEVMGVTGPPMVPRESGRESNDGYTVRHRLVKYRGFQADSPDSQPGGSSDRVVRYRGVQADAPDSHPVESSIGPLTKTVYEDISEADMSDMPFDEPEAERSSDGIYSTDDMSADDMSADDIDDPPTDTGSVISLTDSSSGSTTTDHLSSEVSFNLV